MNGMTYEQAKKLLEQLEFAVPSFEKVAKELTELGELKLDLIESVEAFETNTKILATHLKTVVDSPETKRVIEDAMKSQIIEILQNSKAIRQAHEQIAIEATKTTRVGVKILTLAGITLFVVGYIVGQI